MDNKEKITKLEVRIKGFLANATKDSLDLIIRVAQEKLAKHYGDHWFTIWMRDIDECGNTMKWHIASYSIQGLIITKCGISMRRGEYTNDHHINISKNINDICKKCHKFK